MAKPKLATTVLDFYTNDAGQYVIDIAQSLSLLNRKSFRQGYVYSVDYIEFLSGSPEDYVFIGKLPETYVTVQAWKAAFEAWKKQRHEAFEETEYMTPAKWADFKVYFDKDHKEANRVFMTPRGVGSLTGTMQTVDVTGSEWDHAQIEVNDPLANTATNCYIGMLGDDDLTAGVQYVSAIQAYGATRSATLSPDPALNLADASLSWIVRTGEASGEMSIDVMATGVELNNQPPYANQADPALPATYPGNDQSVPFGYIHDYATSGSTGRPIVLDGGLFPCGLMTIEFAGEGGFGLRVHLTRGTYKGSVAALPMGDFN